jgi:TonB family protein
MRQARRQVPKIPCRWVMRWKITARTLTVAILAATGVLAQDQGATQNPTAGPVQPSPSAAQYSSSQDPEVTNPPQRIRVGGNVSAAKLTRQVTPIYPKVAEMAHISGTVVLHCIVGKDGSVRQLEYVSGPPLLMKSAMDAVRQWQYEPTLLTSAVTQNRPYRVG